MPEIKFNETLLVFISICVLIVFAGAIVIFGSFVKLFLNEQPLKGITCPEIQLEEETRVKLEEQADLLLKLYNHQELTAEETALVNQDCLHDYNITLALGLTYLELGQYRPARDFLSLALTEREDAFIYDLMAQNEIDHCRYRPARDYLLMALELKPANYHYWERLINLEQDHLRASDQQIADLYQQGIEASGDHRAFRLYARFLEERDRYQAAADVWADLLVAHPQYQEYYEPRIDWLRAK